MKKNYKNKTCKQHQKVLPVFQFSCVQSLQISSGSLCCRPAPLRLLRRNVTAREYSCSSSFHLALSLVGALVLCNAAARLEATWAAALWRPAHHVTCNQPMKCKSLFARGRGGIQPDRELRHFSVISVSLLLQFSNIWLAVHKKTSRRMEDDLRAVRYARTSCCA